MTENFSNTYQTTLNNSGTLTSGATSMVVTSATGAPAANFRVKIEDELILVTAVAGTTFTITRGTEGTSAAGHADGTQVTHVLTAASMSQTISEGGTSGILTPTHLNVPQETPGTTEGRIGWDPTSHALTGYDTQRARAINPVGWVPILYMPNIVTTAALTTATSLAASGGSIAMPFYNPGHMLFQRMEYRNSDTSLARSAEGRIYVQRLNNGNSGENTLDEVPGTDGTDSFTSAGASGRSLVASGAPVYLPPGVYWYVLRNTHASNTLGISTTAISAALSHNSCQTKTLGSGLGSTLDFVAATWTKQTFMVSIALKGRVFGQTTFF